MHIDLAGTRIAVSGGARGIGAAVVRALAAEGAAVMVLDVLDDLGTQLADETNGRGQGRVRYFHCDVTSRDDVTAAFGAFARDLGGLDGLVHAAGIETRTLPEDISDGEWHGVVDVSLTGAFLTNQAAFGLMRAGGGGRILNFASAAGLEPFAGAAHYSAAKAGVIGWSRSVAHAWGRHGITVNTIAPAMWSPMYEATRDHFTPEELERHDELMAARIPLGGRLGDADRDLAPLLVVLLSDVARFVTGQIFCIDGGLSHVR